MLKRIPVLSLLLLSSIRFLILPSLLHLIWDIGLCNLNCYQRRLIGDPNPVTCSTNQLSHGNPPHCMTWFLLCRTKIKSHNFRNTNFKICIKIIHQDYLIPPHISLQHPTAQDRLFHPDS